MPCNTDYFNYNANDNVYYVKLHVHVITKDDGTGDNLYTPDMIEESLNYLDRAFNPHKIYFVRNYVTENNCIQYNQITSYYELTPGLILLGYAMPDEKDDGINIYYFPEVSGDGGGISYISNPGNTGKTIALTGTIQGQSVGRSFGIAHEVGHCLGLCHTFNVPHDNSPTANCQLTYDNICSTNPDFDASMLYHLSPGTCNWVNPDPIKYPNYNPSTDNIMSYTSLVCMQRFTDEQGIVMRNNLKDHNPFDISNYNPVVKDNNYLYTTNTFFENDLIIKNRATVTVNSGVTLSFATNRKIRIEPGTTLNLYGKVTSACGPYWTGIEVEGNPNESQTPANQGRLITYSGSSIENALIGIHCPRFKAGGIVDCKWTTFKNNNIAVSINKYELSNAYCAKFNNCTFITDNSFKANYIGGFETFAKLNLVRGVRFSACNFANSNTASTNKKDGKGYGIYSLDAGFTLTYGSNQVNICCVGSNMSGLSYGVYQANLNGKVYAFNVDNTTFANCYTGIYVSGAFGGKMVTNTFNMGGTVTYIGQTEQYGIVLNGSVDGYILEENYFNQNLGGTLTTIGTSSVGTGTFNNIMRRNHYYGLTRANEADLVNGREDKDLPSGLNYLCNTNAGIQRFDFLNKDALKRVQGFPVKDQFGNITYNSAGNTFTHSFATSFSDFNNNWSFDINYHHPNSILAQTPTYFQKLNLVQASNNTYVQKYCPQPCNQVAEDDRTTLKLAYFQNQSNYISRLNSVSTSTPPTVYTEMNYYKTEADRTAYLVVDSYINDTLGYEEDTLRVWLGRLDTYTAKWRGNLAQPTTLTAAQQIDWSNLQQIQTILQSESWNNLSTTSINTLQAMAHNPYGLSWMMAKNVLQENGFHNYPYWVEEPTEPRNSNVSNTSSVKVFPNPTNGLINISLPMPNSSANLFLYNIDGTLILNKQINGFTQLNYISETTNILIFKIVLDNGVIESGKIQLINNH